VDVPVSILVRKRLLTGEPNPKVGAIRNIAISNLTADEPRPRQRGVVKPSLIVGLPDGLVENVLLEHARIVAKGRPKNRMPTFGEDEEEPKESRAALTAAGFFIAHARTVRLHDVTLSYQAEDARPSLVATDLSELELEDCNMQRFAGVRLIRLEKVEKCVVRRSNGLSERNGERVDLAEE
jgi:hypothetical protein